LNRPLSPIRHDYKPSAAVKAKKLNALPWFAAGLGLPLVALAVYFSLPTAPAEDAVVPIPVAAAPFEDALEDAADGFTALVEPPDAADGLVESVEPPAALVVTPATAELATESATDTSDAAEPEFHPPLELPPAFQKLTLTIQRGDTLDRLFRRNSLSLADLALMVRVPEAAPYLKKLIPGDELIIEHDDSRLMSLYREIDLTSAIKVTRGDGGFSAELIDRPLEVRRKAAYGRIETSLFESAQEAGLPDKTVMNLAGIFAWDVDFVLDIRTGDDYFVLYEQLFQDGKYIGDGEIVAAEFNNNGRTIQAIRYIDKNGRADYFTPDGRSVRKAFIRAPVDFTRISSNFNPSRKHPILNTIRAHKGVDYAAPRGTPIRAAGDGKVIFRGKKGGYGNAVILQHGGNITTLYAHMNSFDKKATLGKRVVQGQVIGYVGMTGLASAPHLHYEYRLNGVHRNPRTVQLPQAEPIKDEYRADFLASVEPILDELLQYKRTQVAALTTD